MGKRGKRKGTSAPATPIASSRSERRTKPSASPGPKRANKSTSNKACAAFGSSAPSCSFNPLRPKPISIERSPTSPGGVASAANGRLRVSEPRNSNRSREIAASAKVASKSRARREASNCTLSAALPSNGDSWSARSKRARSGAKGKPGGRANGDSRKDPAKSILPRDAPPAAKARSKEIRVTVNARGGRA